MAWTAATVEVTYVNGADNPTKEHNGHVNDFGLFVIKERATWQVCSSEGLRVAGLIPTRKAARDLADRIGPMAPVGWTTADVKRWRADDPDGYAQMAALLR